MDNEPALTNYRKKRDPKQTPEPFGSGRKGGSAEPIFVVQRHDARRLHYDFRLEENGALASWAVPKGVPLEPGARALAVHVEDHPLEYGSFEGEIPSGQYGAGSVELWDTGTYELVERKPNGQRTIVLHGQRLRGTWSLVPAHLDGKEENWLLIRRSDGEAHAVAREYSPMLATPADRVPTGPDWRYEVKFDGYRALAYVRGGDCRLVSRNRNDLTQRFAEVAKAVVSATKSPNAVLDGEVVRLDADGRASFSELQQGAGALVYYVFDLLEVDGEPLVDAPLSRAQAAVAQAARRALSHGQLLRGLRRRRRAVPGRRGAGPRRCRRQARRQRLPGRAANRDWIKVKTQKSDEFVIVGYTRGSGRREHSFGALVLAAVEDGQLRYAGNVGTGFDDDEIDNLLRLLRPLQRDTTPLAEVPKLPRVRKGDVQWVEPKLVAEVRFSEWTHDRHLRHPSYLRLRDDKEPAEVVRAGRRPARETRAEALQPRQALLAGRGDHQGRPAPVLPGGRGGARAAPRAAAVHDAPLSGWRVRQGVLPEGRAGAHARVDPRFRAHVSARDEARTKRWIEFPVVSDELALLWMVNMGCIDMNAWYSRIDRPDRPDFVLFDLDPTPEVPWTQTVEVALILKQLLDTLGLESFPKTSGGKGFHVLVPIDRRSTYEDTRSFAEVVAGAIVRAHPKLATTEWSKARRRGVLIDANQNGEGKTIASAYSVRPHPGRRSRPRCAGTRSTSGSIPRRTRWTSCSSAFARTAICSPAC